MDNIIKKFKLPQAEKFAKIITRFPPEPSGYLHVGHAKAAIINQQSAKAQNGEFILRFDDTNPAKEKMEFFESIKNDLLTLGIKPDRISHTSDQFDQLQDYLKQLIDKGLAFADDTLHEQMKEERMNGIASKNRELEKSKTMQIFEGLKKGQNKEWCIRAKIDFQNKNKVLRDPVFFRAVDEPHQRFGTKQKAYPIQDFATPIVDSLEGVTHCMRTNEQADRHHLQKWLLSNLGLHEPIMHDFSRLNFKNTVLSKRKLNELVDLKVVEGWNDPRFPTIQGMMRRGVVKESLVEFMQEQGHSKNTTLQEWSKLYSINKKYIDPLVPRQSAVMKDTAINVTISNFSDKLTLDSVELHQKNKELGFKTVYQTKNILIEKADMESCIAGEKITLMKWGNAIVKNLSPQTLELQLSDKDFKGTKKFSWVANTPGNVLVDILEYDNILTKADAVDYDGPFIDIVNKNSKFMSEAIAEPSIRSLKKGDKIQIERRGQQIVESVGSSNQNKFKLIQIPDGSTKTMSGATSKVDVKNLMKGDEKEIGGKKDAKKEKALKKGLKEDNNDEPKQPKSTETNAPKAKDNKQNSNQEETKQNKQKKVDLNNIDKMNQILEEQVFLCGPNISETDVEFIRKFKAGEYDQFKLENYPNILSLINIMSMVNIHSVDLSSQSKTSNDTDKNDKSANQPKDKSVKPKKEKENKTLPEEPTENNFSQYKLVVGQIKKAWKHETAEKLFCEEIEIGNGEVRKIASGLVGQQTAEELTGKKVIVFANLKEKSLVGFPSHGMVMCVSTPDKEKTSVKVLDPPKDAKIGDIVTIEGCESNNWDVGAKKLIKVMESCKDNFKTDSNGIPTFEGKQLKVNGNILKSEIKDGFIS